MPVADGGQLANQKVSDDLRIASELLFESVVWRILSIPAISDSACFTVNPSQSTASTLRSRQATSDESAQQVRVLASVIIARLPLSYSMTEVPLVG